MYTVFVNHKICLMQNSRISSLISGTSFKVQTLKLVPIGTSRYVVIRLEKKSNIGRATQCYNFLAFFPYKIVLEKRSDGAFALNKNGKSQFLTLGSSTNFLVLYENQHFRSMGICQHKFQILYFESSPRNKHAYPCSCKIECTLFWAHTILTAHSIWAHLNLSACKFERTQ